MDDIICRVHNYVGGGKGMRIIMGSTMNELPVYFQGDVFVTSNGAITTKHVGLKSLDSTGLFQWFSLPGRVQWTTFKELQMLTQGYQPIYALEDGKKLIEWLMEDEMFQDICNYLDGKEWKKEEL